MHIGAVGGEVYLIQRAKDLKAETSHSFSSSFDFYTTIFGMEANFLVEGFYTSLTDVFILEEIGTKIGKNLGIFIEGEYSKMWDSKLYQTTFGLNYTFK